MIEEEQTNNPPLSTPTAPETILAPFEGLKKKDAPRAIQTFFRTSFRTHVSIAAMADRKANIMLRLNSFLLSGALIFFKNILDASELSIVTLILFLFTTLFSLVFSALVSRPHRLVTKKEKAPPPEEAAKQVFFFTHFVNMKKEDYEAAFDIMLKDTGLIYGNMARDIYDYGKVIAFKYKLLRYSYNIFIYGLGFTLISFLIALFITKS